MNAQSIYGEGLIEATFTAILLYLVLTRAEGFSSVVRSLSSAYVGAVKALQGR